LVVASSRFAEQSVNIAISTAMRYNFGAIIGATFEEFGEVEFAAMFRHFDERYDECENADFVENLGVNDSRQAKIALSPASVMQGPRRVHLTVASLQ
jgi:hypothetical protein